MSYNFLRYCQYFCFPDRDIEVWRYRLAKETTAGEGWKQGLSLNFSNLILGIFKNKWNAKQPNV